MIDYDTIPRDLVEAGHVRWGLIGCGWLARDYTAPAIHASPGGRLVAAFDPNPAAAAAVRASEVCGSLGELLARDDVDAVYVATPNHLHKPQTLAAVAAGKHVLCEKPTALDAAEAGAMFDAADDAGVLLATAYDQRHHGAHRVIRRCLREEPDVIGVVTTVRIRYACWTGRDWRPPGDLGVGGGDNWRVDPARAGGGAMIDLAPHGLDLTQHLLGEPITDVRCLLQRRVHADTPVDDGGAIVARTAGGALLDLSVAYNCPETLPRRELQVIGTNGLFVATDTMGQTPGGKLELIDAATGRRRGIDFRQEDVSPFLAQIEWFADRIGDRPSWAGLRVRDLNTMRLLDACRGEAS